MNDFIIIKSKNDLPKKTYYKDHAVYLCITKSGRTLVCRYLGGEITNMWENTQKSSEWIDSEIIVAYKRIKLPDAVKNACTGKPVGQKYVEYFDAL